MKLSPRYDGSTILSIDGSPSDQLMPFVRQRNRMQAMMCELSDHQWMSPSRCDGWTARDVAAHLVSVNAFWHSSIVAGLAGTPSRVLAGFDPAATPPLLVDSMAGQSPTDVLNMLIATHEALLDVVSELDEAGWRTLAESPVGHVPIHLVVQHALWDSWVHERDITLALGLPAVVVDDEVQQCLRYAAALSPALGLGLDVHVDGAFAVAATDPDESFVLEVGPCVSLRSGSTDAEVPCLRGPALALLETLSLRAPLPASTPVEWSQLLGGIASAFDADALGI